MKYNAFISYSHAADGKLAPALQEGLEKFAKPWYKLRNLNIFRDETSLSASPHLWANITKALDGSEFLIYMASPESASSKWVIKEIEYWLERNSLETILIVLTDGEINWDSSTNDFADKNINSLPEVLENSFQEEPFYIDFRAVKSEEDISLNNPIFKKEILKLAAHIHGKAPKDMAGSEVQVHRNMVRVRNSAIFVLVALLSWSIYQTSRARTALSNELEARNQKVVAEESQQKEAELRLEAELAVEREANLRKESDSLKIVSQNETRKAQEATKLAEKEKERADLMQEEAQEQEKRAKKSQILARRDLEIRQGQLKFVKALLPYNVSSNFADSLIVEFEKIDREVFFRFDSLEISSTGQNNSKKHLKLINYNGNAVAEIDGVQF